MGYYLPGPLRAPPGLFPRSGRVLAAAARCSTAAPRRAAALPCRTHPSCAACGAVPRGATQSRQLIGSCCSGAGARGPQGAHSSSPALLNTGSQVAEAGGDEAGRTGQRPGTAPPPAPGTSALLSPPAAACLALALGHYAIHGRPPSSLAMLPQIHTSLFPRAWAHVPASPASWRQQQFSA